MLARALPGAALAVAALVLAGCRSDRPADAAAQPAGTDSPQLSSAGNVVTVTTADFTFDAPAKIPAGLTTFRLVNKGPSLHHIQLLKLEDGKTADDLVAALQAHEEPRWAVPAGGPNPPEPGSVAEATLMMTPGNYMMVCFVPAADGAPHVAKGMMRPLTVTGVVQAAAAAEPTADVVVKLVDYDFQLSGPLTAGRHMLRIENEGPQPHEIAIVRLNPGKSPEDYAAWGERPTGPPPGTIYGGVSGIMPGTHAFVPLDLPAGDYALLCFVPDMKDGKPHLLHGMAKKIKVG